MRTLQGICAVICIGLFVTACAAASSPASHAPSAPNRVAQATATATAPTPGSSSAQRSCPNPHGGQCLGPIAAGTYTTKVFETRVTYTVPDGWANYEDLPGNMLLVPPESTLQGVDAGTGDYIGLGDGVSVASANCEERRESGVEATPEAMAAYFTSHEGLETTTPERVEVGGLEGWVVDLGIADGYTKGCPYEGWEGIPMVPMIIGGTGPASLHHVVVPGFETRLYLLAGQAGRVLSIEISDHPDGPPMAELDAVVQTFEFADVAPPQ